MVKIPDVAGALTAINSMRRGPRVKSPVYEWLASNHATLAAAFAKRPASWKALADYLGDGGVVTADNRRPSPVAVRSAWLRVEADLARKRPARSIMQPVERAAPRPDHLPATPITSPHDTTDPLAEVRREMAQRSGRKE